MGNRPSSNRSDPGRQGPPKPSKGYLKPEAPPPPYTKYELSAEAEDALVVLQGFDTWFIVDDSRSMAANKYRCWNEARDALAVLADKACQYDADGIDVFFLNNAETGRGLKSGAEVVQLFDHVKPISPTPIGHRLETLLRPYVSLVEKAARDDAEPPKPLNVLIVTDGEPTDDPESVIAALAKRLDACHAPLSQLGLQFVQVGVNARAAQYLQELDDSLVGKHKIRDIVDTTCSSKFSDRRLTADALAKALVGGVNRRVDKLGYGQLVGGH